NGQSWTPSPAPGPIRKLQAVAPNDAWVWTFNSTLFHWDGQTWTDTGNPGFLYGDTLWDFTASGPNIAWAVGGGRLNGAAIIRRWNGSWQPPALRVGPLVPFPSWYEYFTNVYATGLDSIWTFGWRIDCSLGVCSSYRIQQQCNGTGCTSGSGPYEG